MRSPGSLLRSTLTTFLLLVIAGRAPLLAQSDPPDVLRFDQQVFVTASGAESTVSRVPAIVTLLEREDIESSPAQDIPDLLRAAGLHVTDLTGARRSFRVDLRGFGATAGLNTLVLVDGRRVNQPDLSGSDWALIPLHRVERIEVIRSSGAVLYGDNASGGVINIITRAEGAAGTRVSLAGGGFGTVTPEASTSGTAGHVTFSVSGRGHRSDGHRENAATEGGDVGGQLVTRLNPQFDLTVSGGYHGDRTGLPGSLKQSDFAAGVDRADTITPDDFADVDDGYVTFTPKLQLGDRGHLLVDVSVRKRNSRFFSTFSGGEFTGDTGIRTVSTAPRVVWLMDTGVLTHHLVAGAELNSVREDIDNTTIFDGFPSQGVFTLDKSDAAVYVRDDLQVGRAWVTAGYRYDSADYTFEPSTPSERSFDAHAGDAGATVALGPMAAVFANVSRSFRYPVLDEQFDFFTNTIDTTLVPQRSVGIEGGVRLETGPTRATVSLFRLATSDEIFFNPVGGPFGFGDNENLDGDSHRTGVEIAVSTVARRVRLGGTLALTNTSVDGGVFDGQEMPGVPGVRASLEARLPIGDHMEVGLDGSYTGERHFEGDFVGAFGDQDDFFLLNARAAYRWGRARLRLDLKNLFDQEYSDFGVLGGFPIERAFYPSPGVHAIAGVDVTF